MPRNTIILAVLLILLGVGFFIGTGATHVTALIPAFVAAPYVILGLLALKQNLRKHMMHIAAALTLLLILGVAGRLPATMADGMGNAAIEQLILIAMLIGYLALSIRSFIAARKARDAGEPAAG